MKKLVLLVHGFANPNGINTTDRLRPFFEQAGYEVVEPDYGWRLLLGVRLVNGPVAKSIAVLANFAHKQGYEVYGVGHSNGCEILRRSTEDWKDGAVRVFEGAKFKQIALIDAAMDNDACFGGLVDKVHVFHNPSDWVVEVSRWLPFNPWGNMGRVGYKGKDPRVFNHKFKVDGMTDHNDFFSKEFVSTGFDLIEKEFRS